MNLNGKEKGGGEMESRFTDLVVKVIIDQDEKLSGKTKMLTTWEGGPSSIKLVQ